MLSERTAIVTGSNRGIGLATVKQLAKNRARVWACARSKSDEFEDALKKYSDEYKTEIIPVYFDVTDSDSVKSSIKEIGRQSKSIDILVNNAGVSVEKFFGMTSMDVMRSTMETNYFSQIQLAQLVSRYMMKQKSGCIVNVASVAGIEREMGGIAYGSSKAAVIFSTKTMALELGSYGIRVNSVSPGFIATDMWDNRNDEIRERVLKETPLARQGTADEIANTIVFLASDMSSYITGQNIVVDGGRLGTRKV